jgi:hypothetical protein
MAEQGTEEKTDSTGDEGAGRHAASDESGSGEQQAPPEQTSESSGQEAESSEQKSGSSEQKSGSSEQKNDSSKQAESSEQKSDSSKQADSSGQKSESSQKNEDSEQTSEQKTQEHSNGQARSGRSQDNGSSPERGQADTSWAEPEKEASGSSRQRSVDVGEIAWRTGNVLATVVRTLALLFAVVLVVNVVLVLVGVNPANGVAQFVGAVADVVILGFRDLFLPADPSMMLIVNSAIAAIFWVFVGELASRVIRYLAARVK